MLAKEYGSNFEDTIAVCKQGMVEDTSDTFYLRTGREALFIVGLEAIKRNIKQVLFPALCCPSMVQPFIQLGFDIEYYDIVNGLKVDQNSFERKLNDNQLILLLHYYGIRAFESKVMEEAITDHKNIIVVQDLTQNLFSENLREPFANFYIASIRKWLSVPDGAVLIENAYHSQCLASIKENDGVFSSINYKAMKQKTEYLRTGNSQTKEKYRSVFANGVSILKKEVVPQSMSDIARQLLFNLNKETIEQKRKENFQTLRGCLSTLDPSIMQYAITKNTPLCFPIVVNNRSIIQSELAGRGIYTQVLWPLPEDDSRKSMYAVWFSEHMLAVPCDQRYSKEDMTYIAAQLDDVISNYNKGE